MTQAPDRAQEGSLSSRVTRRDFLKLAGVVASILALPKELAPGIAKALAASPRLPVVWLGFQDCTGDTESFLRAGHHADPITPSTVDPTALELLLDYISLEYHETLMAPSGLSADKSLDDVIAAYPGQYVCVIEGSIPTANNGSYCTIRGQTALSIAQRVTAQARATVAIGTCAMDGGLPAAVPNLTGAKGVQAALPGIQNLLALPGCPANVVNFVASLVHLISFNELPACDSLGRPLFAYGNVIHNSCERIEHFQAGEFVRAWGDDGHRQGWCLYRMGCKGPATKSNCSSVLFNDNTCWPVRAGHGCVGCANPGFWDSLMPIYKSLG